MHAKAMFNRMGLVYLAVITGGLLLLNPEQYHLQYLNTYRYAAKNLASCASTECSRAKLYDAVLYYKHIPRIAGTYETYNALGFCFYHLGDLRLAGEYFRKALLEQDNFGIRFNLALTYARLGELSLAKESMQQAYRLIGKAEDFYVPNMILMDHPSWPKEMLDDPRTRVVYEWQYARYQCEQFLNQIEQAKGKFTQFHLYNYIPLYKVQAAGGQETHSF